MIVIDKPTSSFNWNLIEKETFPAEFNESNVKEDFDLLFQENIDPVKLKEILRTSQRDPNLAVRKFLWKRILLGRDLTHVQLTIEKYNQNISKLFGKNLTLQAELPDFIDRQHLVYFYLNEEGKSAVSRLLNVLATAHPDITFAPLLIPLASLFLHYMSEAECYACLLSVVESNNKITQTDIHWITTNHVFRRFAQKYAHAAYEYVLEGLYRKNNDPEMCFEVIDNWIWWIFEYLPFNYVLNIVDSFLLEGQKVLYRYGIAILDSYYKQLPPCRPLTLEPSFMSEFCRKIQTPFERLLRLAFGLRNMSRKDIESVFQVEEKAIKKYRSKNNETYLNSKDKLIRSNLMKDSDYRRKSNSVIGSFIRPPLIENVDHQRSVEKKYNFSTSNLNEKTTSSVENRSTFSIVLSNALKSIGYNTGKKWHQTPSLTHSHSFYHHHHPQSNINLPAFSVENTGSSILRPQQIAQLWRWLPTRYQILELNCIYSTNIHGRRLMTLFDKIEYHQASVIVVQTVSGSIFGAFCSQPWSNRVRGRKPAFFGNGETFLFELAPNVHKWEWIGIKRHGETSANQELFMYADIEKLIVGGGHEKGIGLLINSDLSQGRSSVSDTFENSVLGGEEMFEIDNVEVFSFNS